jgi:hypothetical protein
MTTVLAPDANVLQVLCAFPTEGALQNDFDGVYIGNASNNTFGGTTAVERNVISCEYQA